MIQAKHTPTAAVQGCTLKWDAPTKARVVNKLLTAKYVDQKKYNEAVATQAVIYHVTTPTIKAWVNKYQFTHAKISNYPDGVMTVANGILQDNAISEARTKINEFKTKLNKLLATLETNPASTTTAAATRKGAKPNIQLIGELQGI
ncbi:MAG: hypothetical protein U9N34_01530 [Candidatus Cloacimonadota bacterium]|nr:hypothetical protein [Candidatus Cloacimonadota bacterium]